MKLLFLLLGALSAVAAPERKTTEAYISEFSALAVTEMQRSGIPASITLAQAILESDSGNSMLAVQGRNHFGIKCHTEWSGSRIYKDDDAKDECFRVYAKAEDSYADHTEFLRTGRRYANLFSLEPTDYKGWASGLQDCGYATSRKYARQLTDLIERYELHRFDLVEAPVDPLLPVPEAVTATETATVPAAAPVKASAVYAEAFSFSPGSRSFRQDGVPCIRVLPGETLDSIAQTYNLFDWELRAFNQELGQGEPAPGTVIYLARRKKARR